MNDSKVEARVRWSMSADIECPKCGHDNDFTDEDDYHEMCEPFANEDFSEREEFTVTCKNCKTEITVTGSDY
jgi:predicted nucleic-acid-binding Zn-ribbon protein